MLINNLRYVKELSDFILDKCDDTEDSKGNFEVITDKSINLENILIIKVDYFLQKKIHPNPKAPDCLIIQRCAENEFDIYVVELKDVKRPRKINKKDVREKFTNCYELFIKKEFKEYFYSDKIKIRNIKLWLVADPHNIREYPQREHYNKVTEFDMLLEQVTIKYFNKSIRIKRYHQNPTIKDCSKMRAS
ncbi:MAG: hypothetical protein JRJ44_07900 [Deltaproteobacteria bacterium]|nr:hypothetical protein [Deltaproteobacteria bacterium]